MTDRTERSRWLALLTVLAWTVAVTIASAQVQPYLQQPPPVECKTVTCAPGKDGKAGPPGPTGPRGPEGPRGPRSVRKAPRAFDLGVHAVPFTVIEPVYDEVLDKPFVFAYTPAAKTAILLDPDTCIAQVWMNFDAGLGNPHVLFDGGKVFARRHFGLVHHGSIWSIDWPEYFAPTWTWNLNAFTVDDPRLGPGTPLCRWRE